MIPNQITTSRFDSWLRRALRIRDRSVVPALATELLAVTGFEMDRPEHYVLGETGLWESYQERSPAAGMFAKIGLTNPAGSSVMAVITHLEVSTAGANAGFWRGFVSPPATTLGVPNGPRDRRLMGTPIFTESWEENFTGGATRFVIAVANNSVLLPVAVVLGPGETYGVFCDAITTTLRVGFRFYWRPMEPSEERGG